jgi:hypothetical protein
VLSIIARTILEDLDEFVLIMFTTLILPARWKGGKIVFHDCLWKSTTGGWAFRGLAAALAGQ